LLTILTALFAGSCQDDRPESPMSVARQPKITPDYAGIVIPPNIAPLNFVIDEPGRRYVARIHSASGQEIEVLSRTGEIIIPLEKWKSLLHTNAGQELCLDVCVKTEDGTWQRYETITNTIAREAIDPFLVYRFMMPSSYFPKRMQICQRNLETFDEETLLDTQSIGNGCANCHSFADNNPARMLLGIRSTSFASATAYVHNGSIQKIDAKFGYTSWHPSGRLAAYSINDVRQFFHTARPEIHDVVDLDSLIVYYNVESRQIKTTPALSDKKRLETYPAWTPDGKYLYFCSAPLLWTDMDTVPPKGYDRVKYDLMRVSYDVETDTWGVAETVLTAAETGLSILLPRVSPDGRFLLFCMSQYGCFPVYQPTSDLYMMDLSTGKYRKTSANSDYAESWHSWSSDSRWIVFSSKRQGGLFTRLFISYVDANGETQKPFALPQKNPSFYEFCYRLYSVPELITGPVTVQSEALVQALCGPAEASINSATGATPKAGSTQAYPKGQSSVQ
jgi:hypothetical protein